MKKSKYQPLCGLFSKIDAPDSIDYLVDAMTGVRFKTDSFNRYGDRNHLKGKDGKTITLKWLKKNGTPIDQFAADFINQHPGLYSDESKVIEMVITTIVTYPTGTKAYFEDRLSEIEAENQRQNERYDSDEKAERMAIEEEDELADEAFKSKMDKALKPKIKTKLKRVSKQRFTREFMLIKRLHSFNGKKVTTNQLSNLHTAIFNLLPESNNHRRLMEFLHAKLGVVIFKLKKANITHVKKLELSNDVHARLNSVILSPKVKEVVLGSTTVKKAFETDVNAMKRFLWAGGFMNKDYTVNKELVDHLFKTDKTTYSNVVDYIKQVHSHEKELDKQKKLANYVAHEPEDLTWKRDGFGSGDYANYRAGTIYRNDAETIFRYKIGGEMHNANSLDDAIHMLELLSEFKLNPNGKYSYRVFKKSVGKVSAPKVSKKKDEISGQHVEELLSGIAEQL